MSKTHKLIYQYFLNKKEIKRIKQNFQNINIAGKMIDLTTENNLLILNNLQLIEPENFKDLKNLMVLVISSIKEEPSYENVKILENCLNFIKKISQ